MKDSDELEKKRQSVVEKYGDWSAHNVHLGENNYTINSGVEDFLAQMAIHGAQLRRVVQIVSDLAKKPFKELRVLDLACLEGMYGLEFARQGAEVIGIEGREANVEKARFAQDALGLKNIEFVLDDVRNLSLAKYGEFDVVLCLGILYHLDAPDVFHFVEQISAVCTHLAVICTHVAKETTVTHEFRGHKYFGTTYDESQRETEKNPLKDNWHSIENDQSFWFTRPSLYNLLGRVGFSSVYTCQMPALPVTWREPDHKAKKVSFPAEDTLVAVKGSRTSLLSMPLLNGVSQITWEEDSAD